MTDPTSLETSQPCVPTKYAEGFKKAILNLLSHEGLWECGGGLKNTHKSYFSSGRETESSFPHIPFSSLSGIAVNMPDFRGRTGLA